MKVLVLSDSHGASHIVDKILDKEKPDLALHLGDFGRDLREGMAVRGNCDGFTDLPSNRILEIEGYRVLMTHGHKEGVKMGLHNLFYQAEEKKIDIVLYGHTHERLDKVIEGIHFINPGSVALPNFGDRASYSVIDFKDGSYKVEFVLL